VIFEKHQSQPIRQLRDYRTGQLHAQDFLIDRGAIEALHLTEGGGLFLGANGYRQCRECERRNTQR